MRSPARLVTGTAAAALTAAALGLAAAPPAHAETDVFGRTGQVAATAAPAPAECGPGAVDGGTALPCDTGGAETDLEAPTDPQAPDDPEAPGDAGTLDDLTAPEDPAAAPEDLGEAAGTLQAGDPEAAEGLSALPGSPWPDTGEEGAGDAPAETDAGDEAGATVPGTRPAPVSPPGADPTGPGSAKPPVPPHGRPTASPSRPSGHVDTGVGGSAAPDTAQLAAGAGLVAAAGAGGALLLRRRRADGTRR
ncbi:hypothetical protein [Streptomyces sp. NPDC005494]|uniref:hypothetical protein n=1 Tax=unclassified Streptomyces TaxID=2593676 RepID=UPI00368440CA